MNPPLSRRWSCHNSAPRSPTNKGGPPSKEGLPGYMPRIPIFKLGSSSDEIIPPTLSSYSPSLSLEGLLVGIDNLRHDVHLSPKFTETARAHIARLIARHGDVEGLIAAEASAPAPRTPFLNKLSNVLKPGPKAEPADLKSVLSELHIAALNRAKADNK